VIAFISAGGVDSRAWRWCAVQHPAVPRDQRTSHQHLGRCCPRLSDAQRRATDPQRSVGCRHKHRRHFSLERRDPCDQLRCCCRSRLRTTSPLPGAGVRGSGLLARRFLMAAWRTRYCPGRCS
jgi:hypothetical protein